MKAVSNHFITTHSHLRILALLISLLLVSANLMAQQDDSETQFGFVGGVGYGSLRYYRSADSTKAETEVTKLVGLNMEIPIPLASDNLSFYGEFAFIQFSSTAYTPHYVHPGSTNPETDYSELYRTFSPLTMQFTTQLKYVLSLRSFRPYFIAGVYNSILLSATNSMETIIHNNSDTIVTRDVAVPKRSVHGIAVLAGAGLEYKWISLEMRYDPGFNFTRQTYYSIYHPALYGLLKLKMFR